MRDPLLNEPTQPVAQTVKNSSVAQEISGLQQGPDVEPQSVMGLETKMKSFCST